MRLPDKTESFHTVVSRPPPPGRSVKYALKYECQITRACFHSFFLIVFLFWASGKRYYPHIHIGHPSANWYNRKESHSEQFIFCISCFFVAALNLILSLRIITQNNNLLLLSFLFFSKSHQKATTSKWAKQNAIMLRI